MSNSFKTDAEKTSATLRLATAIKVINNIGKYPATTGRIAEMLEVFHTALSPSSESFWNKALEKLVNESMVGKSQTVIDDGRKINCYRLLKPLESIEAFFSSYKWDKRQRKTRERQDQPIVKTIVPKRGEISKSVSVTNLPKSVLIEAGSVKITIQLQ